MKEPVDLGRGLVEAFLTNERINQVLLDLGQALEEVAGGSAMPVNAPGRGSAGSKKVDSPNPPEGKHSGPFWVITRESKSRNAPPPWAS